jgi:hypothetical protein
VQTPRAVDLLIKKTLGSCMSGVANYAVLMIGLKVQIPSDAFTGAALGFSISHFHVLHH